MAEITLDQAKKLLVQSIKNLKTRRDLKRFIDDIFTPQEILDLGQRLRAGQLILKGKTYEEIAEKASVSTTTVTRVGQALKHGAGGLEKALKKSKRRKRK